MQYPVILNFKKIALAKQASAIFLKFNITGYCMAIM